MSILTDTAEIRQALTEYIQIMPEEEAREFYFHILPTEAERTEFRTTHKCTARPCEAFALCAEEGEICDEVFATKQYKAKEEAA
jgi:hypothetical protein